MTSSTVVPIELSSYGKSEVTDEISKTAVKPFEDILQQDIQSKEDTTSSKTTSKASKNSNVLGNSEDSPMERRMTHLIQPNLRL
ncbi:hypothetical protein IEQ34_009142 [Dendrobium chrysotoxum]|uniref:Uncharacterized protein n=1 Tax=Dendrobium chrysotoxum TaxID=161865 RepID=A0AAV7H1A4_DENCH|nr:hypothetical protein IEQ34_009142 [Dendrobium chrysotoxum]